MLRELQPWITQPWQLGRAAGPPALVGLFQLYSEGAAQIPPKLKERFGTCWRMQIPNLLLLLGNGSCKPTRHVHPPSNPDKAFASTSNASAAGVWISLYIWEAASYLALIALLITLIPLPASLGEQLMMPSLATPDQRGFFPNPVYLLAGITFKLTGLNIFVPLGQDFMVRGEAEIAATHPQDRQRHRGGGRGSRISVPIPKGPGEAAAWASFSPVLLPKSWLLALN